METFVRRDFYISPPDKNASPDEWADWLKKDNRKAAVAKRKFTLELEPCDIDCVSQDIGVRKINGVYKQCAAAGLSGSEDNFTLEPIIEPNQEIDFIRARFESRPHSKQKLRKHNTMRKAKKAKRLARKLGK
jgi:hypothetical protein